MTSPIQFSRKPYTVTYRKDGEIHKIRRRPPPKLHDMLPTDVVTLTRKKNDDYLAGDEFKVKGINPKHPNTIQIEDDDGNATFVSHYDLNLDERRGLRNGVDPMDLPEQNRYLLWP